MGFLSELHTWGGHGVPPIISGELYIICNFGGYMQVYTHKPSLHGNFQTSPIFACGAMTSFWVKITSFWTKIG